MSSCFTVWYHVMFSFTDGLTKTKPPKQGEKGKMDIHNNGAETCSVTCSVNKVIYQAKMVSSRLFLVRMVPGLC